MLARPPRARAFAFSPRFFGLRGVRACGALQKSVRKRAEPRIARRGSKRKGGLPEGHNTSLAHRSLVQYGSMAVGAVFLLVGILGFIPGVTTDHDTLTFAGHESGAKLIGLFNVSILHNIVHLLFGIAGIAMARTANTARTFLVGGGVIYLVLWVYWLVIDQQSMANFIPVNSADNWLHFVLASG